MTEPLMGISEKAIPWGVQKCTADLSQLGHIARMTAFSFFRRNQKEWQFWGRANWKVYYSVSVWLESISIAQNVGMNGLYQLKFGLCKIVDFQGQQRSKISKHGTKPKIWPWFHFEPDFFYLNTTQMQQDCFYW